MHFDHGGYLVRAVTLAGLRGLSCLPPGILLIFHVEYSYMSLLSKVVVNDGIHALTSDIV